ncbi:type IV toxin-antitoxin system AbiEi family antitoxin domain-containing protein [Nocardioides mesophilus]|uniref:Type IV toxin-antitoxin system AbiEi family antitoxin domain-containing protein n=1 Tax=Nocardioides mesophilus TaxID=433659 RepID=A0A7G9RGB9_9ACTN|nr:type IV toxin-antitoxin system AbiEi family antitoxin domain-containing protein [Nocardioides mesophilus]QNN54644.1 type IV toxin-antitoxin system AbiEi family antitoxin domain-containing protein [Nocardioides mesophilus]
MDQLRALAEARGFFTRAEALRAGHDDQSIRRAVRAKLWHRIRPGAYTFSDLWARADTSERHRTTSRSVVSRLAGRVVASHVSAALHHGLEVHDVDLSLVHVTRTDGGAGRTEAGVQHHEGLCLDDDTVAVDGVTAVRPARAALETASMGSTESGVVVLDAVRRRGCSWEQLEQTHEAMRWWPRHRRLDIALRLSDPRSESVGESRSKFLFWAQRLPAPDLQFEVHDGRGQLVGVTDFAWPELGLLGEFDGKMKYGRLLRPGEKPGDAVFREKIREDRLREITNWGMVRLVWDDLSQPVETAERIRHLFRVAA